MILDVLCSRAWNWLGTHCFQNTVTFLDWIGIGTADPVNVIHVKKSGTDVYVTARIESANSTAILDLGIGGSAVGNADLQNNAYISNAGNSDLVFCTNGSTRMVILNDGKVGIGTVSPTAPLQVVGLAEHADNAAALLAGLTAGAFYRTGDLLKVVH